MPMPHKAHSTKSSAGLLGPAAPVLHIRARGVEPDRQLWSGGGLHAEVRTFGHAAPSRHPPPTRRRPAGRRGAGNAPCRGRACRVLHVHRTVLPPAVCRSQSAATSKRIWPSPADFLLAFPMSMKPSIQKLLNASRRHLLKPSAGWHQQLRTTLPDYTTGTRSN
jgi:hypothetical protein